MSINFSKRVENFICDNCGIEVTGNGFTNHCSSCLYSKHVDNNPGDRLNLCLGLMEPIGIEKKGEKFIISHKCEKCGLTIKNRVSEEDNFEKILDLIKLTSYN